MGLHRDQRRLGKNPETAFGLDEKRDLNLVRSVRQAVGDDIAFMVDVGTHVKWNVAHAIQMTRRIRGIQDLLD